MLDPLFTPFLRKNNPQRGYLTKTVPYRFDIISGLRDLALYVYLKYN